MNKMDKGFVRWVCFSFHLTQETYDVISTSKRRLIDVLQASYGRLIDVETTSSVYLEVKLSVVQLVLDYSSLFQPVLDFFNLCQGVFCFQNVRIYCFQYVRILQVLVMLRMTINVYFFRLLILKVDVLRVKKKSTFPFLFVVKNPPLSIKNVD